MTDQPQAELPAVPYQEIQDLVARFDDAVNRRDKAEFASLWCEDAIWEVMDPMPGGASGREAITETWWGMVQGLEWMFRGSFAGTLSWRSGELVGRWPCIETGTFKATADHPAKGYDNRAVYEDIYRQENGRWLFAHRRYLYLWLSTEPLPGGPVPLGPEL